MTNPARMTNHAIGTLEELEATARRHVAAVAAEQRLLRSCFKSAGLAVSFPRAQ